MQFLPNLFRIILFLIAIALINKHRNKTIRKNGIKTRIKKKISEGSEEILESIKKGYVTYVINSAKSNGSLQDGKLIRRAAIDNNVPVFTCLDTVKVLLDVLEEITMKVSVIDEE